MGSPVPVKIDRVYWGRGLGCDAELLVFARVRARARTRTHTYGAHTHSLMGRVTFCHLKVYTVPNETLGACAVN